MIVSHDSGFLDTVCTDIIHYETRKLVHYKVRCGTVVLRGRYGGGTGGRCGSGAGSGACCCARNPCSRLLAFQFPPPCQLPALPSTSDLCAVPRPSPSPANLYRPLPIVPRLVVPLQGNLAALVAVRPEARTYYELSAATLRFKFPDPGFLDGIKGKTQAIAKMTNVRAGATGGGLVGLVGEAGRAAGGRMQGRVPARGQ